MESTENLPLRDLLEIIDAANGLGLYDATAILVDAIYDHADGRKVEDLSDVLQTVRQAALTCRVTPEFLRYRQKELLNIIF